MLFKQNSSVLAIVLISVGRNSDMPTIESVDTYGRESSGINLRRRFEVLSSEARCLYQGLYNNPEKAELGVA
jgi:hypothetical protein